jgi:putative NIF3 family GTP cyclohydrolase 1 type 2
MKRREFILATGLASVAFNFGLTKSRNELITAIDLQNYLRSLCPVKEPSVDRIILGDPDTKIKKVGTAWTPYLKTLKDAVNLGINVIIVHEPTFYRHWDLDNPEKSLFNIPSPAKEQYLEAVDMKKKWVENNGLVIIRSHDVPDVIKGFGMPFALGQKLGFKNEDIVNSKDFYNVYRIKKDLASNVAKNIASNLKDFDQPGIAFYGDPERVVSTVGLGTGYICNPQNYAELNPDLYIAIDDQIRTWIQTTYSDDTGIPLVVINHGTSEEMGMRLLNEFLSRNFPGIEFIHLNQGCSYKWITA